MEKLYNLYSIISNKTVRSKEKLYKKYAHPKEVPGTMVITNRGYFIDGRQVDNKSADLWFEMVRNARKHK